MIMVIIMLHFGQTQFPSRLSSNAIDTGLLMTFDFFIPFLGEREEGRRRRQEKKGGDEDDAGDS